MTNRRNRRALLAALLVVAVSAVASDVGAQTESRCDERFPEPDWTLVAVDDGVTVSTAALKPAMAARFADHAFEIASLLRSDLGAFPDTTLCLFGPDVALDGSALQDAGLLPPGQRLHAARFADEALLFVDTQQARLVADAIAQGFTHIALWRVASDAGDTGYPEPLASAIAQWYAARLNGRLAAHRSTMRVATFYSDPRGNAPASDWFAGAQEPMSVWNPEYQESPIGALVEDAVSQRGTSVLQQPEPEVWAAAELAWRAALRQELLQGAHEARDWVGGVLIAGGALVAAVGLALWGRRQRRRRQVPVGDIAHVEGFFDR